MAEETVNELFRQYRETGDKAIRNRIAEKYLYIADILAKKFVGRGVEYDDLKQVASLALLKGIDRFDPSLGMQFTTFITPTITGEIKNYFRDKSRLVKLPRAAERDQRKRARLFRRNTKGKNGRQAEYPEIADSLGISEEEAVRAHEWVAPFPSTARRVPWRRRGEVAVFSPSRQRRQVRAVGGKGRPPFGDEKFIRYGKRR